MYFSVRLHSKFTVNALGHPGGPATFSGVFCYSGSSNGPIIVAGELLVDLASVFYGNSLVVSTGFVDTVTIPIPGDGAFIGRTGTCQGFTFSGATGTRLCNAEDVMLGL